MLEAYYTSKAGPLAIKWAIPKHGDSAFAPSPLGCQLSSLLDSVYLIPGKGAKPHLHPITRLRVLQEDERNLGSLPGVSGGVPLGY